MGEGVGWDEGALVSELRSGGKSWDWAPGSKAASPVALSKPADPRGSQVLLGCPCGRECPSTL